MGARLSKRRDGRLTPPRQAAGVEASSSSSADAAGDSVRYTSGLSSYAAACKADPAVQSFDITLQARTGRALSALAAGVEVRSLSVDSLKEVTACLLDMNQEVVKVILLCKKDVWKSPQLFDLVEEYFENSLQTLDFCDALEKCLRRARDSQMMLDVALRRFHEEDDDDRDLERDVDQAGCRKKNKYVRTLAELRSFAADGNPFTAEFFAVLRSVHAQQLRLLEKLQLRKGKLDKKLRGAKAWRRLSCIIFAAAFAAILVCSVVAAAVTAPPVAAALASAASVPVGSMGRWFDSLLKGYHDELRGRKELVDTMRVGAFVAIKDLDGIRVLAEQVEDQMDSLLRAAEFAGRREGDARAAVGIAVVEIGRRLAAFGESIDDLGEQADRCGRDIRRARTVLLQRIIKHPS